MIFDRIFLKFILVGMINTIVGSAIMFSLYNLAGLNYWVSSALNYILASILSFFLNKYFTFSVKTWSFRMFVSFALTILVSYLLAYGIAERAMNELLRSYDKKFRENVSLFCGMCLFTGLNYLGQRFVVFWVHRPERSKG
jgi:putative flippase GtrA